MTDQWINWHASAELHAAFKTGRVVGNQDVLIVLGYRPNEVQPWVVSRYINGDLEWLSGTYCSSWEQAWETYSNAIKQERDEWNT